MDRLDFEEVVDEVSEMDGADMLATEDMSMEVVLDEVARLRDVIDAARAHHGTMAPEAMIVPCVVFVG